MYITIQRGEGSIKRGQGEEEEGGGDGRPADENCQIGIQRPTAVPEGNI